MSSSLGLVSVQFTDGEQLSAQTVYHTDRADYSGANTDIQMNPNGSDQWINSLLQNTSVGSVGFVDSIALQSNFENVTLIVKDGDGQEIARASGNADNVARFQRLSILDLRVQVSKSS